MRKACVEPIRFRDDGSIPEVQMTSQGAGGPGCVRFHRCRPGLHAAGQRADQPGGRTCEALTGWDHNDKGIFQVPGLLGRVPTASPCGCPREKIPAASDSMPTPSLIPPSSPDGTLARVCVPAREREWIT
ncbi:MAG: hypothetical protein R2751_18950 [Bacteroidales bacterium]